MQCMEDYGSLSQRKHIEVHVDKITPSSSFWPRKKEVGWVELGGVGLGGTGVWLVWIGFKFKKIKWGSGRQAGREAGRQINQWHRSLSTGRAETRIISTRTKQQAERKRIQTKPNQAKRRTARHRTTAEFRLLGKQGLLQKHV